MKNHLLIDILVQWFSFLIFNIFKAYIGGYKAVGDYGGTKLKGYLSWFLWRSAYLTKTVSLKNKILIPIDWSKTFLFGRDITKF
jgi:NADH:ubiquinone reductase (non-electrogenic)